MSSLPQRLALLLACLFAAGCGMLQPSAERHDREFLPSGVMIRDLVVPESDAVAGTGDRIELHYELFLNDGTPIDSSYDNGLPISLVLGAGALPAGIEEGVVGMRLFGRRKLVVPPELGYGEAGLPPLVPPGSVLRVYVELMSLEPGSGSGAHEAPQRD